MSSTPKTRHVQTLFALGGKSLHPFQRAGAPVSFPVYAPGGTTAGGLGGNQAPAAATNTTRPPLVAFAVPRFRHHV